MKRNEFTYLIENKQYTFSERNREDSGISSLQDKVRQNKFRFIQENVSDTDDRLALLMAEMDKVYSETEMAIYISGSLEEQYRIAYDSFKIKNNISYEEFKQLLPQSEVKTVIEMIYKIESIDQQSEKKKKGNR